MRKHGRDPILDMPRAGASECAAIFGWKTGSTFKRNLGKLPPIKKIEFLKGTFYVLEDVFRARFPDLDEREIQGKLSAYLEKRKADRSNRQPIEWIGPKEAARIMGYRYGSTFKRKLNSLPKIKSKKNRRGRLFDLRSVFQAVFQYASDEKLDDMITEYQQRRAQERLKGVKRHENSTKT